MQPIVVLISGEAYSGKDTTANYLIQSLSQAGISAIKVSLGDRLKVVCHKLIKLFYGIDIPLEAFYDSHSKDAVWPDAPLFAGKPFCLRTIMQQIGTGVFRDLLWQEIWCDYVQRHWISGQASYQVLIIADNREPHELAYFRQLQQKGVIRRVISVRIERDSKYSQLSQEHKQHQSERLVAQLPVDFELPNHSSLDCLYQAIDLILVKSIRSLVTTN